MFTVLASFLIGTNNTSLVPSSIPQLVLHGRGGFIKKGFRSIEVRRYLSRVPRLDTSNILNHTRYLKFTVRMKL